MNINQLIEETQNPDSESVNEETYGISFLSIKPFEDAHDLELMIPLMLDPIEHAIDYLDIEELFTDSFQTVSESEKEFLIHAYPKMRLTQHLKEGETLQNLSDEDREAFWAINYKDHLGKFFYRPMIESSVGALDLYVVEYDGPQEELARALKLIKGRSSILNAADSTRMRKGSGIRGQQNINTVEITKEWILTNVISSEAQEIILNHMPDIGLKYVFYDFPTSIQYVIYKHLPKDLQIELVHHKIHSPDDVETTFISLFYLLRDSLRPTDFVNIYELSKTNKSLACKKLLEIAFT